MNDPESNLPIAPEAIRELESKLYYNFKNPLLLLSALTHSSAKKLRNLGDYERLEFLGDAVLDLTVAHLLIDKYPTLQEGELSKRRAALVNAQCLANFARTLELNDLVILSRAEQNSGGALKTSILADVVEAIFGAIYLDGGFTAAFNTIRNIFDLEVANVNPKDPKTELQELLHALKFPVPEYQLDGMTGPEHAPEFISSVKINGQVAGTGQGATKKASQQAAAESALANLRSPKT